jgi:hypothetical protein
VCVTTPPPPPPPPIQAAPPPPATRSADTAVIPDGTVNVKAPVEVYEVTTGAFTVIVNCLVDVDAAVEAETVNVDVVFETTSVAVPVIAAVDEFKDNPAGKEPDEIEYVIVSPSASVAAALDNV